MKKSVRRASIALAMTPLVSIPLATVAFADTVPAPPGDASAVAASLDGVVTIAGTTAHAGSDGAKAHATALGLGGNDVVGGSSDNGTKSGNLIATGNTPLGDVEVLPWTATASQDASSSSSSAEAALAHANIANAIELWVLHSKSMARWQAAQSGGDSVSDGAELNLGGGALDVKVLHSEAHSGAKGSSALLVVNGTGVVSSGDVNGSCEIPLDPLLHLICLTATGGVANGVTSSGAEVVGATLLGGQAPGAAISDTGTTAGNAQTPSNGEISNGGHVTQHGPLPHTNGPSSSGHLPFTGSDAGLLTALGAALAAIGAGVTTLGRRRRGATA
jgi:hypothetical protein